MKEDNYAKIAQIYKALYGEAMFGVPQIKQLEINRNMSLCFLWQWKLISWETQTLKKNFFSFEIRDVQIEKYKKMDNVCSLHENCPEAF